ncbi:beta-N-acetylhexosaminidase [Luteimicrobium subarcticum]|uniref:beta-N-acetylhexosaminidase n=1 Tax=Luteimicrobium subarcticum TaxID=620910 RepID=A0A2M8WTB8_9MICO|nr:beta-N-acetylhexosaminidase [Luteimicrobium subarcticum]PJI94195.1 hexosaminidase [Luteimicrobium subarcticum]
MPTPPPPQLSREVPDGAPGDALGLVPAPARARQTDGTYRPGAAFRVATPAALAPAARWWAGVTRAAWDVEVAVGSSADDDDPGVRFALDPDLADDAYALRVDDTGVVARAGGLAGAHSAAQVLRQLAGPAAFRAAPVGAEPLALPHVTVEDRPRLGWRGVLLDVARHFLPKHDVLRFVDLAAAHRLDVVQLHLTDDQGWRFESHRYPRLTEVGAWRAESGVGTWRAGVLDGRPHGGFYTQDDLREVVAYARARGVTVVPEVDAPGHVEAAVAAYPELGTRKQPHAVRTTWGVSTEVLDPSDASLAFFRDVLDEVMDVFDSPFVALGGDEVPTTLWKQSPTIVARAAELGLDDVADLHPWFLARLCEHVIAAGRRPVVWDEAFRLGPDGRSVLPRETVVTSWRGWAVGAQAMAAGHDVVMAPEQVVYLDHRAGDGPDEPAPVGFLRTVADVHAFDPLPAGLSEGTPGAAAAPGRLLGAQAEVWSEQLDSARRVDYATFPRLAAFAEAVWRPEATATPEQTAAFVDRLARHHLPRLDAYGVEYRPLDGPHAWQTLPGVVGWPRDLAAELAAGGLAGVGGWVEDHENSPAAG